MILNWFIFFLNKYIILLIIAEVIWIISSKLYLWLGRRERHFIGRLYRMGLPTCRMICSLRMMERCHCGCRLRGILISHSLIFRRFCDKSFHLSGFLLEFYNIRFDLTLPWHNHSFSCNQLANRIRHWHSIKVKAKIYHNIGLRSPILLL